MVDLILEFGCESCYLQNKDCGGSTCIRELKIDLKQLYSSIPLLDKFYEEKNEPFRVEKDFFLGKCMPDVWRYDLRFKNNQWILCEPDTDTKATKWKTKKLNKDKGISDEDCKPIKTNNAKNILIILESPHDAEYQYEPTFEPIQPANGTTGEDFYRYFESDILNYKNKDDMPDSLNDILIKLTSTDDLDNVVYNICFVNPVPFQTSLHYFHRKSLEGITEELRDMVWKELFKHCETNFISRLNSYKPCMIINACTGQLKNKNDLKSLVKNSIDTHFNCVDVKKFNTAHPSSWWSSKNRYCKKW